MEICLSQDSILKVALKGSIHSSPKREASGICGTPAKLGYFI